MQNWDLPTIFSLSSLAIAICSVWISFSTFKRDSPKLEVSIGVRELRQGRDLEKAGDYVVINIVNIGRRPIILNNYPHFVEGNELLHRFVKILAPNISFRDKFMIDHPELYRAILGQEPGGKVLNEGQVLVVPIEIKDKKLIEQLLKTSRFCVTDTKGNAFYASSKNIKELKKSLQELEPELG